MPRKKIQPMFTVSRSLITKDNIQCLFQVLKECEGEGVSEGDVAISSIRDLDVRPAGVFSLTCTLNPNMNLETGSNVLVCGNNNITAELNVSKTSRVLLAAPLRVLCV